MTTKKAIRIAEDLKGKKIGDWIVDDYINNGKSALVCKCFHKGKIYAIKIYDEDLIEEFGEKDIKMRIDRQLEFTKKRHKNLIRIYGGGFCKISNKYFLIMEYLDQFNLSQIIDKLPRRFLIPTIKQITDALIFLETNKTYHRDIKPDNISITKDFKKVTVLDLGVIKPLKIVHASSSYPKNFFGTLQYSPREFLLGDVEDSDNGWRAVTFYQLGAVIYDLIERKQIFEEYKTPWGRLSNAVIECIPEITAVDIPLALRHLCLKCLNKDPENRLKFVSWEDFNKLGKHESTKNILKRIEERKLLAISETTPQIEKDKFLLDIEKSFEEIIPSVCKVNSLVPPFERLRELNKLHLDKILKFNKNLRYSLSYPLTIIIRFIVKDVKNKIIEIKASSFLSNTSQHTVLPEPSLIIHQGCYTKEIFYKIFESYFYSVFDIAQSTKNFNTKTIEIKL